MHQWCHTTHAIVSTLQNHCSAESNICSNTYQRAAERTAIARQELSTKVTLQHKTLKQLQKSLVRRSTRFVGLTNACSSNPLPQNRDMVNKCWRNYLDSRQTQLKLWFAYNTPLLDNLFHIWKTVSISRMHLEDNSSYHSHSLGIGRYVLVARIMCSQLNLV